MLWVGARKWVRLAGGVATLEGVMAGMLVHALLGL